MRDNRRDRSRNFNKTHRDRGDRELKTFSLPSPSALESYEEISPGFTNKLTDLIKIEQKHRQEWENKYLNAMINTARIGQLLGLMLAMIIIYATVFMATSEKNKYIAATICISGFASLACATLASTRIKHSLKKPQPFNKHKSRY